MHPPNSSAAERVVAVVVAFNRRDLLRQALNALHAQSSALAGVVVVDNLSSDDSAAVARAHPIGADVIELSRNTGGAGGFASGIARAVLLHDADLIWLMDDDTIPEPTALAELLVVRRALATRPAVLASRVVWTDGSEHPMNRPRQRPGVRRSELESTLGVIPVRSASFVSLLVDGQSARSTALPVADYFIWNDDFEYTTRLLKHAAGYYCTKSVVTHKTKVLGSTDVDPGERFYFEVRNKIWLFQRSRGLGAGEKVLYLGASLVRWGRTLLRVQDKRTVARAGWRGLRAGLARGPRSNRESLVGTGDAFEAVEQFESTGRRSG